MPRAVRFDKYGGIEVLQVVEVERPSAGPGKVLVRVKAAGINPGEAIDPERPLCRALAGDVSIRARQRSGRNRGGSRPRRNECWRGG